MVVLYWQERWQWLVFWKPTNRRKCKGWWGVPSRWCLGEGVFFSDVDGIKAQYGRVRGTSGRTRLHRPIQSENEKGCLYGCLQSDNYNLDRSIYLYLYIYISGYDQYVNLCLGSGGRGGVERRALITTLSYCFFSLLLGMRVLLFCSKSTTHLEKVHAARPNRRLR